MDQVNIASTSARKSSRILEQSIKSFKVQDRRISSNSCNLNDTKQRISKSPTNEYKPSDSTTVINPAEWLRKTDLDYFMSPQNHTSCRSRNNYENVDSDINQIIQWPIQWLVEQSNVDISPPVCGDLQALPIPNVFKHYQEYVNIMRPLIFLELWQFIYQSACNKGEARYAF